MENIEKGNKRTMNAWAFFDWANSAFALVIAVAIFPAYFLSVVPDQVTVLSFTISDSALYSFSISLAYILIICISPILSGIADYAGIRKLFLRLFTYLGSLSCITLFFFVEDKTLLGTTSFILATIGFAGGLVFYNSYLPLITTEDNYDKLSAKGFAYGYIGSVILLLMNLIVINNFDQFGLESKSLAVRVSFIMVGLWWLGFAHIPFRRLPADVRTKVHKSFLKKGYLELIKVWHIVKREKNIKRFLASFFFYSAGVQTILYLASAFAEKELVLGVGELILIILILQIVAIGGAYLFAFVSGLIGNKLSITIMLIIWILVCILAYFVQNKIQFYFAAALVGLVMGGIQSLSRSTYSKLIQKDTTDPTSFFSFYDILEKGAIVTGTLMFGIVTQISGDMRSPVLVLTVFFLTGLIILQWVDAKTIQS
jgi:UMF1 family MFS transporter